METSGEKAVRVHDEHIAEEKKLEEVKSKTIKPDNSVIITRGKSLRQINQAFGYDKPSEKW